MRKAQKPSGLGFTYHDRLRLKRALHQTSDARLYRRIQAVLLVAQGRNIKEVSEITSSSVRSVYQWVYWYRLKHQIDILVDLPRSGRPVTASCITDTCIERELQKDPLRLGYCSLEWTAPLLSKYLSKRYGSPISAVTLRRRMRAMGLRWKRPRYVFQKKASHISQKKQL